MPPKQIPGSPEDWLSRAHGKLLLASQIPPPGVYLEDLCFLAQQTAELAIKAVYQARGWRFVYTHDLARLLDDLEELGFTFPDFVRQADKLTIFASEGRYPGMTGIVTPSEYQEALVIARQVLEWAELEAR